MPEKLLVSLDKRIKDEKAYYRFSQTNTIRIREIVFGHTTSEADVVLQREGEKDGMIDCRVTVEKKEKENAVDLLKEMKEYVAKLSDPFDTIVLRVAPDGEMHTVLNRAYCWEKWTGIKKSLQHDHIFNLLPPAEKRKFLETGDDEFGSDTNILQALKRSPLFGYLFMKIYNKEWPVDDVPEQYGQQEFASGFFKDIEIPVELLLSVARLAENVYDVVIDGTLNKRLYPAKAIRQAFEKDYHQLGEAFRLYTFDFRAVYRVDETESLFSTASILMNERVNESLNFYSHINITATPAQ